MQDSFYNGFLKNWEKFQVRLRGQIMMQADKGVFTYESLNLLLADCAGFWDSPHSEGGRWLIELEKAYPKKAELVRTVLFKDMKFSEETNGGGKNSILQYAVPVGTAVAGCALSRAMGASDTVQAVCTLVPGAAAIPLAKNIVQSSDKNKKKEATDSYLKQLEKYRLSAESVLKDI